jgi:hypothetical protein
MVCSSQWAGPCLTFRPTRKRFVGQLHVCLSAHISLVGGGMVVDILVSSCMMLSVLNTGRTMDEPERIYWETAVACLRQYAICWRAEEDHEIYQSRLANVPAEI